MIALQPRVLWGAIGVLTALLVLEWAWPEPAAPQIKPHPARQTAPRHTASPARDTQAWGETVLARPLFSVSRRPPRIAASNGHAAAPTEARLAGIMITPYGRRAIFAPDTGKQLVLREGAAINESTIRAILPDRVILANGTPLVPSFDHRPGGLGTTQQPPPNFQNPGFPNPNFQNPGFPNPGFVNPNLPVQGFQPGLPGQPLAQGQPNEEAATPGAPFRNPLIQPRRE